MKDIVFVKGNILFKSGDHLLKEMVAYATKEWEKIAESIIQGDLIITDQDTLEPFKIYCASQDIATYGNFISGMQSPKDVIRIYQDEINNLQKLRKEKITAELIPAFMRQIYIGVVGTMELFLCDFLLSMVLGHRKYFEKFIANNPSHSKNPNDIINTIIKINFHRIKNTKEIYQKNLDLSLPPTDKLQNLILTRHSLVHRNGFPTKNSEYIKVTDSMIDELITEVQKVVDHITDNRKAEINDWMPDPSVS